MNRVKRSIEEMRHVLLFRGKVFENKIGQEELSNDILAPEARCKEDQMFKVSVASHVGTLPAAPCISHRSSLSPHLIPVRAVFLSSPFL